MKKILAFLSAVAFLGSSTLAVTACGPTAGVKIDIKLDSAPKRAENGEDPLTGYVYNNQYVYSRDNAAYLLTVAAQLVTDRIYEDPDWFNTTPDWNEFYQSDAWQRGSFKTFGYTLSKDTKESEEEPTEPAFSYSGAEGKQFIVQVNNNDLSVDKNILRSYWFITSEKAWSTDNNNFNPTKDNIAVPNVSEFNDEVKTISKTGYVHLYLVLSNYRIDFSAQIKYDFNKMTDKNGKSEVILNSRATFAEPFGKISSGSNTREVFQKVISNVTLSKS